MIFVLALAIPVIVRGLGFRVPVLGVIFICIYIYIYYIYIII